MNPHDPAPRAGRGWFAAPLARLLGPRQPLDAGRRDELADEIDRGAEIDGAYALLLIGACGIATLGLLQSSTAVVIGAMLISPLMSPILALGVGLARVDPRRLRRAGVSLLVGAVVSVLAAGAVVALLPLKTPTPEILARTQPNLLDLAIAALSGFVGAYVTISGRAAVIAGVAIATALMPPLAVVGFGLATDSWSLSGGAALLFLTNVVAMVAAAFVVARSYGFHPASRGKIGWEAALLALALAALAAPLALSFRDLVTEARLRRHVETAVAAVFKGAEPRIEHLQVSAKDGRLAGVQALVVTRRYVADAAAALRAQLGPDAKVSLEQVLTARPPPDPKPAAEPAPPDPAARLQAMLGGAVQVLSIDRHDGRLTAQVRGGPGASLADYRAMEAAARVFTPGLEVNLTPPWSPLPPIRFAEGASALDDAGRAAVDDIAWALQRWSIPSAQVIGSASPGRRGPTAADRRLAKARAQAVAARLAADGVQATTTIDVPMRPVPDAASADWSARVIPQGPPPAQPAV